MPQTPRQTASERRRDSAAQKYCRSRDLKRLLPMWPSEIEDHSVEGKCRLLAKLRRALREERRRGLAGHWAYDLARHAALFRAYRAEVGAEQANWMRTGVKQPTPARRCR